MTCHTYSGIIPNAVEPSRDLRLAGELVVASERPAVIAGGTYYRLVPTELPPLTLESLKETATEYSKLLSATPVPALFGVTDGKAVGTYVEAAFNTHIATVFAHDQGNAAKGIDFPGLGVDLKVTSIKQPQSSSPFRDATQKVYGLGYHLLVFVYDLSLIHI